MSVQKRLSRVGSLSIDRHAEASVVQLGDNSLTTLYNRTIALQRAIPNFEGDETRFAAYPIFSRPILELQGGPAVVFNSRSSCPEIRVGSIQSLVVTASSLLRLGISENVFAESRIKHIRQFNDGTGTFAEKRE